MNKPVYISLTSIFSRQERLYIVLSNLLKQTLLPNKIYIYLSDKPSFFDNGYVNRKITYIPLENLIKKYDNIFNIIWGDDIGSYGKLLPLLKIKWKEDCLIITLDDDTIYDFNLIKNLILDYNKHNCVINYRGFTPNIKENLTYFNYNCKKNIKKKYIYNFPTGKAGILYHPSFFHKTGNLIFDETIYKNICKTGDDIWYYFIRIANNIECYIDNKKWLYKDLHVVKNSLCIINNKNDSKNNNEQIKNVFLKLTELGYL